MKLNDFQKEALSTCRPYADWLDGLTGLAMGLVVRAVKVMDHTKSIRDHNHKSDTDLMREVLGDVLWYTAALADALGLSLEECAAYNLIKTRRIYPAGFNMKQYLAHNKQPRKRRGG